MPFWAARAVTPVTLAPTVRKSTSPAPVPVKAARRSASRRSAVSGCAAVDRRASLRLPETSTPTLGGFVLPRGAGRSGTPGWSREHGDTIHVLACHTDPDEPRGHRIPALQHDSRQVDARPRSRRDDDAALAGVRDAVAAGADAHFALDLSAGARGTDAGNGARRAGAEGERENM